MPKRIIISSVIFTGLWLVLSGQADTNTMVKYTPDFQFNEGIFINFEQVRQNRPIPRSRIATSIAYDDPDFYEKLFESKKIAYFNNIGAKEEVPSKNIWGYARNGILYININDDFYRITIIGSICHFVANVTTYNTAYGNPYSYPYYGYYNYYNTYGYTPSYASTEMRQYILDFKTGRVLEYTVESVKVLLMADPELHDEFARLSKKKQKQLKFLYIRKFNERNPLYFPKN